MEYLRDRIALWLEVLREQKENKQDTQFIKGKLQGAADVLWNMGWDLTVDYTKYTYTLWKRD